MEKALVASRSNIGCRNVLRLKDECNIQHFNDVIDSETGCREHAVKHAFSRFICIPIKKAKISKRWKRSILRHVASISVVICDFIVSYLFNSI
jgi:hypothetical protein